MAPTTDESDKLPPPHVRTYDEQTSQEMAEWGAIGAAAGVLSLLLCILAATKCLPGGRYVIALLAAAWAILPPVWFWWEYFFRYRTELSNPATWEYFKHGQQLGVAVWAGFAASIGAFALSPLSDPADSAKPELKCELKAVAAAASVPSTEGVALDIRLLCK
jgi:hypothetical protein